MKRLAFALAFFITGVAPASCEVFDRAPATVAAASDIAVKTVNNTNDDCSTGDVECIVSIFY